MSTSVRLATVLLTFAGTVFPLVAVTAAAVTAKTSPNLGRGVITRWLIAGSALVAAAFLASLSLMMMVPEPYAEWSILTLISTFGCGIGLGVNAHSAYDKLDKSVAAEANVHNIESAPSRRAN